MPDNIFDKLRALPWLVAALIATAVVAILAPHQIGLLIWSLSKLCLSAYLGYWIDRTIYPYARPHALIESHILAEETGKQAIAARCQRAASGAMIRRAIVMAAAIVALGLGV